MTTATYLSEVEKAIKFLHLEAGVVAVPTDTVYGVICRLDHPRAIERLYEIAGRRADDPVSILAFGIDEALCFATGDLTLPVLLGHRFWPGPLTIVVRASEKAPAGLMSGEIRLAARVPVHPVTMEILSRLPNRVAAFSSAWLPDGSNGADQGVVAGMIGDQVDYIVEPCGYALSGTHATIVDVSGARAIIVRQGAVPEADIMACVSESGRS